MPSRFHKFMETSEKTLLVVLGILSILQFVISEIASERDIEKAFSCTFSFQQI